MKQNKIPVLITSPVVSDNAPREFQIVQSSLEKRRAVAIEERAILRRAIGGCGMAL